MVMRIGRVLIAALLAASLASARAQDATSAADSEARSAFERGLTELRAESWVEAEQAFRRSLSLVPRPSAQYNLAFVLFKQGRMRESADCLRELARQTEGNLDASFRESSEALLSEVLSHLAMLYIRVEPDHAQLTLDGRATPLAGAERALSIDPGGHRVTLSARGYMTRTLSLVAQAGGTTREVVELVPLEVKSTTPAPHDSALARSGPWLTAGLGAAALIAAGVVYGVAKHADDEFSARCPSHRDCDPQLVASRDNVVHLRTASEVLAISGGVLIATGISWQLMLPASSDVPARGAGVMLTVRR